MKYYECIEYASIKLKLVNRNYGFLNWDKVNQFYYTHTRTWQSVSYVDQDGITYKLQAPTMEDYTGGQTNE